MDSATESPEGQSVIDVTQQHETTQKRRSSAAQPDGRKREPTNRTTQWSWSAATHPVTTKIATRHQQGSRDRNAQPRHTSERRPESTEQRSLSRQQGARLIKKQNVLANGAAMASSHRSSRDYSP